jgi:hypothetical protein
MEGCCNDMKMISSRTLRQGSMMMGNYAPGQDLGVRPNQLGQLDIVDDIFGFATSLFGKDPQKVEYDKVRQQAWDSLVTLVDEHGQYTSSGNMTRSIEQKFIDTLTQLMDGFKKYTDGMLAKYPGDSGWITPRFHDYYDFMGQVRTGWQQELATLPADYIDTVVDYFTGGPSIGVDVPGFPSTPVTDPITGQTTMVQRSGFDTTSMLLIGGVVLGLVFMSQRKRG